LVIVLESRLLVWGYYSVQYNAIQTIIGYYKYKHCLWPVYLASYTTWSSVAPHACCDDSRLSLLLRTAARWAPKLQVHQKAYELRELWVSTSVLWPPRTGATNTNQLQFGQTKLHSLSVVLVKKEPSSLRMTVSLGVISNLINRKLLQLKCYLIHNFKCFNPAKNVWRHIFTTTRELIQLLVSV